MNMETRIDFLRWLSTDMALKILACLDDAADLICASAVSRYWKNIVISNELTKKLCVERFPELTSITRVTEPSRNLVPTGVDSATDGKEPVVGEKDHKAYASLLCALTSFPQTFLIGDPISASSTDRYPQESILKTIAKDKILHPKSYWSSKGSDTTDTPETLIYRLKDNFCVITEIYLHPFQALFQLNFPIYSSKYIRFRMGHPKCWNEIDRDFVNAQECADDKFIWTYTSKMFPVSQENRLQRFELPEPVVCIGGFLQVELLGRVQKQDADGKYYICVARVQAIGRKLSPAFSVEFSQPSNVVSLKYDVDEFVKIMQSVCSGHSGALNTTQLPVAWGDLQNFMNIVQAHWDGEEDEWVEEDEFGVDGDDDDEIDPIFII
ncbi:F-box protein At4g00755-like [Rutidosis leptorrhynchoides]|uniref:F-box protein At4g00755-like n=1 Tax=Rutidosis leptorrhynchoides TaxID=125765 RepID=UPI003A99119E